MFPPKTRYLSKQRKLFWTKPTENETPEGFWKQNLKLRMECNFNAIAAELLITKRVATITDKHYSEIDEKTLELRKTSELIKGHTETETI